MTRTDSLHGPITPTMEILFKRGILSSDQLRIISKEREKSAGNDDRLLVSLGFVSEIVLREAIAESLGHESVDLSRVVPDSAAIAMVSRELAQYCRVVPLDYDPARKQLSLACAEPENLIRMDRVRASLPAGTRMRLLLAGNPDIEQAIDRYYGYSLSIDHILGEIETAASFAQGNPGNLGRAAKQTIDDNYSQPVIRLIDALLTDAVKQGASDIHFEPEAAFVRIRYRVDGILRQIRVLHRTYWPAMAVRLKVMASLDIAETRIPQDGHIFLQVNGHPIDFRISVQPTLHGENIVLRILDRNKGIVPLEALGLAPDRFNTLKAMIARPEGMILVTGPTGCGKTTTLYSILNHINRESVHIMTLEDPVEYPLPLLRQSSVTDTEHFNFSNGIRSMMRQDPDVILVGEIRDNDTAGMAFRAAMTGHQVYSTLHTHSALGALPRLLDLGITPEILGGNIIGIIAQRLVRRLCPDCKIKTIATPQEKKALSPENIGNDLEIYQSKGCAHCHFQGYRGRFAIMEILRIDPWLDDLIMRRAGLDEIRRHLISDASPDVAGQFHTLADDGIRYVLSGETSLAELRRVVDLSFRFSSDLLFGIT